MTQITTVHPTEIQKGDRICTRIGVRQVWKVDMLRNRNGYKIVTLPLNYCEPLTANHRGKQAIAFRRNSLAFPIVARSHVSKIVEVM